MNKIYTGVEFNGHLGFGSYIGDYSKISGKIGRYCSIAPYVRCNNGIHPYTKPFTSTSPVFYSLMKQHGHTLANEQCFDELVYAEPEKKYAIVVGNDVWIGEGVFIVGGITIGDGAMILAHAVITKDVPPYAIVGGVPAKIIKCRFDERTIDFLMRFKWWDMSTKWLKNNIDLINNIDELIKQYGSDSVGAKYS